MTTIDIGFWPAVIGPPPTPEERRLLPEKCALMDADIAEDVAKLKAALEEATDPTWRQDHPEEYEAVLTYLNRQDHIESYRGSNRCRVCGVRNGSHEYFKGPFRYPEGYVHYLEEHGFKPPQVVIDAALGSIVPPQA